MNLEDIQPWIKTLIDAKAEFAAAQVTAILDDGTYPKTPTREQKLTDNGLAIIIWQVEAEGLIDASERGFFSHEIYVPVVIEENVKVNRAAGGTLIEDMKALRFVLESTSGKRSAGSHTAREILLPMDPPFKNFGKINGINRIIANLCLKNFVTPA